MNQVLKKLRWKTRRQRNKLKDIRYNIQYWLISKLNDDVISEYAIDTDLLTDYYNEPYEHDDYIHDRD